MSEAEEWISELDDKMVEITAEEQDKVKRMKRMEDSLRDLWDNIKHTNMWGMNLPHLFLSIHQLIGIWAISTL